MRVPRGRRGGGDVTAAARARPSVDEACAAAILFLAEGLLPLGWWQPAGRTAAPVPSRVAEIAGGARKRGGGGVWPVGAVARCPFL